MRISYDSHAEELARYFLENNKPYTEADVDALAQVIQKATEDWLEGR